MLVLTALTERTPQMSIEEYARNELSLWTSGGAASPEESSWNNAMVENVMALLKVFSDQGHSGASAATAIQLFSRLASFKPLAPLTGADSEWTEHAPGDYQNKRCSSVFKKGSEVYDRHGYVFVLPGGGTYTTRESRRRVKFPYTPATTTVHLEAGEEPADALYRLGLPNYAELQ